jgi:hypothetical protein
VASVYSPVANEQYPDATVFAFNAQENCPKALVFKPNAIAAVIVSEFSSLSPAMAR